MTEAEWLGCTEPRTMLAFLRCRERLTERKLRLLACGCCRTAWHELDDERSREAVRIAERFADGQATLTQLQQARVAAFYAARESPLDAPRAARFAVVDDAALAAEQAEPWLPGSRGDLVKCAVMRDVFGNPFRPITVAPDLLRWNDGTIPRVARTIYVEHRFEDLPILADALEEAGCSDSALLAHCRGPGERPLAGHVRGCWLVDLLRWSL